MGREREGLEEELRALGAPGRSRTGAGGEAGGPAGVAGGSGVGVEVERVVAGVMARVAGEPVPVAGRRVRLRRWVRRRLRVLLAAFAAVLVGLALAPPVRAGVASLFDFGGVAVRVTPSATPPGAGAPPGAAPPGAVPGCGALSPDAAARRAGFRPPVPREWGPPDAAGVSADGRMVSLCWSAGGGSGDGPGGGGAVRLDAFRGTLDPLVGKTSAVPPEWEEVATGTALWFPEPHRLELLLRGPGGGTYTHPVRTAGPTLLWQGPEGLTLRLEGVPAKRDALRLADSAS
ncbi:hypothetical protein O7599_14325 [Streptomyces sp. WMMC500]|uniref:hypothetical protein n=1 Tax=Streptomyces sp. WMMC500 TaxID=3015154 RepID=UPI00248B2BA9|nr:hypothetical protein [Streptomyces sp. WMMC500]WBB64493.1 hypothetical protein O7599_14325 [Streptomyces sp. WMMC500]